MELLWIFYALPILLGVFLLIACFQDEAYIGATLVTVATIAYFSFIYGFMPLFNWVTTNPGLVVGYVAAYILLGMGSSFFLWDRFCAKKGKYWREKLGADPKLKTQYMPDWTNNKARITAWTIWWPFSMLHYVIGRLVVDFIEWVQLQFGNIYKRISERHFKDASDPEKPRLM